MAMKTVTTHICDRCGRESEKPDFNNGNRSGSARISVEGRESAMGHDGAWGGYGYERNAEICFSCATEFREWFESFIKGGQANG